MSQYDQQQPVSGWATGGLLFAATLMFIIGTFQAIAGLVAIFDDGFYLVTENYVFDLDVTAWGWIHLLLGILLVVDRLGPVRAEALGRRRRDHARLAERDRELLLHPVLPLVVAARDLARHLGHLVADATRSARAVS